MKFMEKVSLYKYNILLLVITSLALFIRLYGIDFGKPFLYHIDEWKLVNQAGNLLNIRAINKDVLFGLGTYPPFFTYILAFAFSAYGFTGMVIGFFSSMSAIVEYYKVNPFAFHLIGRIISALMGTATVPVLYMIGKSLYNKKVGLIAASFLTFLFIHVRNSHYSTVDIPVTFFVILSFYFITLIFNKNELKYYILASVFSGFAIACKYNVVFIVVPLALAILFRNFQKKQIIKSLLTKKIIISIFILCFSFVIACPLIVIDVNKFLPKVSKEVNSQHKGKLGLGGEGFFSYITGKQGKGFGFTNRNSMAGAMGKPLMLLSLLGFIFCLIRHRKADILLVSFPIFLYILHGNMNYKAMRHILPLLPFLLIMSTLFLEFVIDKIKIKQLYKKYVFTLIVLAILIPTSVDSFAHVIRISKKDTRTQALEWVEKNLPDGTKIAVEFYGPQVYNTNEDFPTLGPKVIYDVNKNLKYYRKVDSLKQYKLYNTFYLDYYWGPDRIVEADPIQHIIENEVKYVIIDSWTYGRFYNQKVIQDFPLITQKRQDFYNWIEKNGQLCVQFDPGEYDEFGPLIKIYHLIKLNEIVK